MTRHQTAALLFFLCALLSIFNMSTILIFDGFDWPFYAVAANATLIVVGLYYHMRAGDDSSDRGSLPQRVVRFLLAANTLSVVPMLLLSLFTLSGEYHTPLTADATVTSCDQIEQAMGETDGDFTLLQTDKLYVYCANYDRLDYACGKRPSRNNESILLCVAAAFQSRYELTFSEDNIVGWHTYGGSLLRGAPQEGLGAFTYVGGQARIHDVDEAEAAIREAKDGGGFGYQSFIVLKDGVKGDFDTHEFRCFRALALVGGRACVIDSRTLTHYDEFVQALKDFGVEDAIYCDMGSGWNYSWYRKNSGGTETIIGMPWPFSHNWLTFVKDAA